MKAFLVLGVMLASAMLIDPCLFAGDKGPPKPMLPKGTPAEQVKELIAQHEKAAAVFRKLYEAAKTEEEQERLEALFPDPRPYSDLLFQIAEKTPATRQRSMRWSGYIVMAAQPRPKGSS